MELLNRLLAVQILAIVGALLGEAVATNRW